MWTHVNFLITLWHTGRTGIWFYSHCYLDGLNQFWQPLWQTHNAHTKILKRMFNVWSCHNNMILTWLTVAIALTKRSASWIVQCPYNHKLQLLICLKSSFKMNCKFWHILRWCEWLDFQSSVWCLTSMMTYLNVSFFVALMKLLVMCPLESEKGECLLCIPATQRYLNNKVNPHLHFVSH